MSLEKITADLGAAYKEWKAGEKKKNAAKDEFFKLINEVVQPEEKLYVFHGPEDQDDAWAIIEQRNPGWTVQAIRPCEGGYEAILESDPTLTPFSFDNPEDGMTYGRQVQAGATLLDDERLLQDDPELWVKVTEVPNADTIKEVMYECGVDHTELDGRLDLLWPHTQRVLRNFEELDPDTLAALAPYIYEGKPVVKLPAPKKTKVEDA